MPDAKCCYGLIGSSKFCIKSGVHGSGCTVQAHEGKKFTPEVSTFYLKEKDGKAFIKPSFIGSSLTERGITKLLSRSQTVKEWEAVFEDLQRKMLPDWMLEGEPLDLLFKEIETGNGGLSLGDDLQEDSNDSFSQDLSSPRFTGENMGIFATSPALSFDEVFEVDSDIDEDSKETAHKKTDLWIQHFQQALAGIKGKWSKTFAEVEASHIIMVKDLQKLHAKTIKIHKMVGDPSVGGFKNNIWLGMKHLSEAFTSQIQNFSQKYEVAGQDIEALKNSLDAMKQTVVEIEEEQESSTKTAGERIRNIEQVLATFEKRFTVIFPILTSVKRAGIQNPGDLSSSVYATQLQQLSDKVDSLQELLWSNAVGSNQVVPLQGSVEAEIRDIKNQLHILQQRVVGGGVQIGAKVFQSFEDVVAWTKSELPNRRYGLFVDAVSLLDFFTCIGHADANQTFAAFHNQQRTGFATMYEARVAASIQNLFPMVFGKSNSGGLDDSEFLPAIQDPDKWDNGSTGLRHQICRGMADVEYQLESAIETVLAQHVEAKQLAKECLYKAKRFVSELCNFITQDYLKWKHRGHHKKDAWKMTSVSVRRVFEDIHSERVVARDIYDAADKEFTTAKFLWATWKAHVVMDRYIKHQFYEHPAIAAVLARHLADNYVKPDDAVTSRLTSMEKTLKTLVARVDTIAKDKGEAKQKNEKGKGGQVVG